MTTTALAEPADVAVRLGRTFTDAETARALAYIEDASALVLQVVPTADTNPTAVTKMVVVSVALAAFNMPTNGAASETETRGPFSRSVQYATGVTLGLTVAQERLLRQSTGRAAVYTSRLLTPADVATAVS